MDSEINENAKRYMQIKARRKNNLSCRLASKSVCQIGSYHSTRHLFSPVHWYQPLEFFILTDVKKIKPFSTFRQSIKNSMIDGCNTVIDS